MKTRNLRCPGRSVGIAASATLLAMALMPQPAKSASANTGCAKPTQVQGFQTCANVDAANKEGSVVLYAVAGQARQLAILNEFHKLFPQIRVQSIWAQTGALYAKVSEEVKTNNTLVDVMVLSDPTLLNAAQKANIIAEYRSPSLVNYKDEHSKSQPEGYWTSWGLVATTIVYNTKTIGNKPPTDWKDLADPRYGPRKGSIKNTTSGLQFAQWKTLADIYGRDYWTKDIAALKPVAFDSYTQQFDRLVGGVDLVAINGQISGAMEYIAKGAPLKIVYPASGVPATLEGVSVVASAPHPEAARLLTDYLLSKVGQTKIVEIMQYFSASDGIAPPANAGAPEHVKFLVPDWSKMADQRRDFEADWKIVLGD